VFGNHSLKHEVREFWDEASCGEVYAQGGSLREQFESQARARYELEPYIRDFARFEEGAGRDVLEIGVGMGADHLEWAKARPRSLTGIDLTPRAIEFTRDRVELYGLASDLRTGDAEDLDFADNSFDLVYSWGVLHHSPDTARAVKEVLRVLRPGGEARVMIYHKYSLTGYMLWIRYALLAGRPGRTLADIYAHHLESLGTKAFTTEETREMFAGFTHIDVRTQLAFGDLLRGAVGQRHSGPLLSVAKVIHPRWLIKRLFPSHGLMLLIRATK
jgi:ubiquinone/menaquinone biosynthesis C-methylase UbiE